MADRVADVEVYLDAVRRPLKYDERLCAAQRQHARVAYALQTLATGTERADQLAAGTTPWMSDSGVRGFYSQSTARAAVHPDAAAGLRRRRRSASTGSTSFMHGRDDQVLEQQFMTKSPTGYTSKPLGPGADRFMLQPYGRYSNASRFAGEIDGLEAIESVAQGISDRPRSDGDDGLLDGRRVRVVVHRPLRR